MIIKASSGNGFNGTLLYVYKSGKDLDENEKPVVIEKNNVFGGPENMARQMREQAENSDRLQKPVLHLSVAFSPEDKLTSEKEIECVKASIAYLGVETEKHQYVMVKHNDTDKPHYHVVINRLDSDNKSLNIDWIKNDCNAVADRVEQEKNLQRVQGRNRIYDAEKETYRSVKKEERAQNTIQKQTKTFREKEPKLCEYKTNIRDGIKEALADKSVQTAEQLKNKLALKNISAKFKEDEKTNKIKGTAFRYDNKLSTKGSAVGYSANIISQKLEENRERDKVKIEDKKVEQLAKPELTESEPKALQTQTLTPEQSEPKTIEKPEKTKLTMEEENQVAHVEARNTAINNVVDEHEKQYKYGNVKPNTEEIYQKNGFQKDGENQYKFSHSGFDSTHKSDDIEKSKIEVQKQFETHKIEIEKSISADKKMLEQKPNKFAIFQKDKDENNRLKTKQEQAKYRMENPKTRQQFTPRSGLERSKLRIKPSKAVQEKVLQIAKEKQDDMQKEQTLKREQNQNNNKSKGLGL